MRRRLCLCSPSRWRATLSRCTALRCNVFCMDFDASRHCITKASRAACVGCALVRLLQPPIGLSATGPPATHLSEASNLEPTPALAHAIVRLASEENSPIRPVCCVQGLAHVLLEQYKEAQTALLEGLSRDPGHAGIRATMAAVDAAIGPEPASPTSPVAAPTKK